MHPSIFTRQCVLPQRSGPRRQDRHRQVRAISQRRVGKTASPTAEASGYPRCFPRVTGAVAEPADRRRDYAKKGTRAGDMCAAAHQSLSRNRPFGFSQTVISPSKLRNLINLHERHPGTVPNSRNLNRIGARGQRHKEGRVLGATL